VEERGEREVAVSLPARVQNTANLTVKGYYLVGSEVYGVPIGMKYQSTWTNSKTHTFPNWG